MREFAHLGQLVAHAQFHAEKYDDDIMVFLSKHYGELAPEHSKDHQEEKKAHDELPFNHYCSSYTPMAFVIHIFNVPPIQTVPILNRTLDFFYLDNYSFLEKSDIFQPPQHA